MISPSAFLIGGTASGSGKTTLTLGIMAAFKARGLGVQPFKCGPDFIDPTLHKMVTGEVSSNLDLRMCGSGFCKEIFNSRLAGKNVAVVEGVMGLFDGGIASSASLAAELKLPVILVVDARSAAESVAAVVKGFEEYAADVEIAGVIFNRVGSKRHRELIETGMQGKCSSRILGFFPRDIRFEIPDRHLGLQMGEEKPLDDEQLDLLVQAIESHIDLDTLLQISLYSEAAEFPESLTKAINKKRVRLAVARDQAFCFYYEDNLKILEQHGAELIFFSPLADQVLPENCHGVYLGGGYPELHAEKLSRNHSMLASVRKFAASGGIIYGECGGFMYLCTEILTLDLKSFTMSSIFPFHVRMKPRLSRLGYRQPTLRHDCFLGKKDQDLHGHEFHYSELLESSETIETVYRLDNHSNEGFIINNVIGGYIHLHFGSSHENVQTFINYLGKTETLT